MLVAIYINKKSNQHLGICNQRNRDVLHLQIEKKATFFFFKNRYKILIFFKSDSFSEKYV